MKITTVTYFKTFPLGSYWEKIGMEATCDDSDPKWVLGELQKEVESFFHNSHPDYGTTTVVRTIADVANNSTPPEIDHTWEHVKDVLNGIEFYEDAEEYINTTDYKMAFEAKKIISQKPRKK